MAYPSGGTRRSSRYSADSRYSMDSRYDTDQLEVRDRDALGNARPSRYGLSSPTNFPPARSPRSPGGFHGDADPDSYERRDGPSHNWTDRPERVPDQSRRVPDQSRRTTDQSRRVPDQSRRTTDQSRRVPDQSRRTTDQPRNVPDHPRRATDRRQGESELDREELERLYRIATGQKEPQFQDALREGPWTGSALNRRGFLFFLAECAVYAACFRYLLDPLTVLTARMGAWSAPAAAAGISLAGTLACMLPWPLFRDRRMMTAAWRWMLAAFCLLFCLLQILLWGESQAQWTAARFSGFFLLGPTAANGAMSYGLLYLYWRHTHPRPKPVFEDDAEEEESETQDVPSRRKEPDPDERSRTSVGRDGWSRTSVGRDGWSRTSVGRDGWNRASVGQDGWNRASVGQDGWNRNLSAAGRDIWDRRPSEADRRRWRQTEADRDGRRRAESLRNKWK